MYKLVWISLLMGLNFSAGAQQLVPEINGPEIFGVRPGKKFIYPLSISGALPLKIKIGGLPKGVRLDRKSGVLTGKILDTGKHSLKVTVSNRHGYFVRDLTIKVGAKLALTPPMGWSSWYAYGRNVTQAKIELTAKLMKENGLQQAGWNLLELDDPWSKQPLASDTVWKTLKSHDKNGVFMYFEGPDNLADRRGTGRDQRGNLVPNSFFPDLKGMVNTLHRTGFKAGIYSSPGPITCAGASGSLGHEFIDAKYWSDLGFDYLKYDWCSYGAYAPDSTRSTYSKPYRLMADALLAQDRDIVFALCQYGLGKVWEWGNEAGGQLWRTDGDIRDNWKSVYTAMKKLSDKSEFVQPGNWNDPDILQIGVIGGNDDQGEKRNNKLSQEEQRTHFSMWCMLSAPLLIGANIEYIEEETLAILKNRKLIAINQDGLGKAAYLAKTLANGLEVWYKPLSDGSMAMAVLNPTSQTVVDVVSFTDLGLAGTTISLEDQWSDRILKLDEKGRLALTIPSHGVQIIKCSLK